jgi:hypothetical protein
MVRTARQRHKRRPQAVEYITGANDLAVKALVYGEATE